jgi:hypothetical protein
MAALTSPFGHLVRQDLVEGASQSIGYELNALVVWAGISLSKGDSYWVRQAVYFPDGTEDDLFLPSGAAVPAFSFDSLNGADHDHGIWIEQITQYDDLGAEIGQLAVALDASGAGADFNFLMEGSDQGWQENLTGGAVISLGQHHMIEMQVVFDNLLTVYGGLSALRIWVDGSLVVDRNDIRTMVLDTETAIALNATAASGTSVYLEWSDLLKADSYIVQHSTDQAIWEELDTVVPEVTTGTPPVAIQKKIDDGLNPVFNPGYYLCHYATYDRDTHDSGISQTTVNEVVNNPNIAGVFLKLTWIELEKDNTKGGSNYNWAKVDLILATFAPKQVILYFEPKNFGPAHRSLLPYYMLEDPSFGGGPNPVTGAGSYGSWSLTSYGGNQPCFWNVNLQNAFYAFVDAFAARYKDNPQFEGLCLWETASPTPDDFATLYPDQDATAYRNFIYAAPKYVADKMPRKTGFQQVNWEGWYGLDSQDLIDSFEAHNEANRDSTVGVMNTDGSVSIDIPLRAVHDRIRDGCDRYPYAFKNENPVSIDDDAKDGISITESMQYYRDRLNPWYEIRVHSNASSAQKQEIVAFINQTKGTRRSTAYYSGSGGPAQDPSYTHADLVQGTTHWYRVIPVTNDALGAVSNVDGATTNG